MKSVLIDASSAILLFKAELLAPIVALYRVAVVPAVVKEITVAGRSGASLFQQMLSAGQLKISPLAQPLTAEPALAALGAGERDTLTAFGQNHTDFVIIDDRKGALWCRSRNVPYINALLCARILFLAGHLSEDNYMCRSRQLLEIGRYSRWVVDFARCCEEGALTVFLPGEKNQGIGGNVTVGTLETHLLNN